VRQIDIHRLLNFARQDPMHEHHSQHYDDPNNYKQLLHAFSALNCA
jgi:hypothetical protein